MKKLKYILLFSLILVSCRQTPKEREENQYMSMYQTEENYNHFIKDRNIDLIPIDTNKDYINVINDFFLFNSRFTRTSEYFTYKNSYRMHTINRIKAEKVLYTNSNSDIIELVEYNDDTYKYFMKYYSNTCYGIYIKWKNSSLENKMHELYNTPFGHDDDFENWDIGLFTDSLETNLSYETVKLYFPDFNGVYTYNPHVSLKILAPIYEKNIDSLKYLVKFENK